MSSLKKPNNAHQSRRTTWQERRQIQKKASQVHRNSQRLMLSPQDKFNFEKQKQRMLSIKMNQAMQANSKEVQSEPIVKKNAFVQTESLLKKLREPEEEKLDKDQQQQEDAERNNDSMISGLNMPEARSHHSEKSKSRNSSVSDSEEDSLNERIEELMYDKKKPPKNKLLEEEDENEDLDVVSQESHAEITHENQTLDYHRKMYLQNKMKFDMVYQNDIGQIEKIREFFSENKIKIIKLNHSVDPHIQRFTQFQGFLQLTSNSKFLEIVNKKPNDQPLYILSADPKEIEQEKQKFYEQAQAKMKSFQTNLKGSQRDQSLLAKDTLAEQGIENELLLEFQINYLREIKLKQSSSSCDIDEIEGFVYGPFTSRFWMIRKHTMMMDQKTYRESLPFHAWDCITLNVKNKGDIYLIIRNENVMSQFLKFLIYTLETVDGRRGTVLPLLKRAKANLRKQNKKISEKQADQQVRHQLMLKVFTKYNMMRVKQKLSFIGLMKNATLLEIWFSQIIKSFRFLRDTGQIFQDQNLPKQEENLYQEILLGEIKYCLKLLIQFNFKKECFKTSSNTAELENLFQSAEKQRQEMQARLKQMQKMDDKDKKRTKKANNENFLKIVLDRVRTIRDKSKCFDVFQNIQLYDYKMYQDKAISKLVAYKVQRKKKFQLFAKMKLMRNLKAFIGYGRCTYLEIVLKQLQLVKELFILDIEQGDEVIIPTELLQSDLPLSFKFYDPVLKIIQEQINLETKDFFTLKNKLNLQRFQDDDNLKRKVKEMIGLDQSNLDEPPPKPPIFKYSMINDRDIDVDHTKSVHSMSLQCSKYVVIENEMKRIQRQYQYIKNEGQEQGVDNFLDSDINAFNGKLNLRFCHERDVHQKRYIFLKFKANFLAKMKQLQSTGHCINTLWRVHDWIDDNIDWLYEGHKQKLLSDKSMKLQYQKSQSSRNRSAFRIRDQDEYEKVKYKRYLKEQAEKMVFRHRMHLRLKKLDEIKFKLFSRFTYEEKNNFMEYQIEDSLRFYGSSLPQEEQDRLKYFMSVKKQMVKNQIASQKLKEQRDAENERQQQSSMRRKQASKPDNEPGKIYKNK